MKHLLFILLFAITGLFANAQSGTGTIDATNLVKITGGVPGTASIASVSWTVQGTPPAIVSFSASNSLKTDITITATGSYTLLLTVKDNLGNIATATFPVQGIFGQQIIIDTSNSKVLNITIKQP